MKKLLLTLVLAGASIFGASAESFDVPLYGNDNWGKTNQYTATITTNVEFGGTIWSAKGGSNNNHGWQYMRIGQKGQTNQENYICTNSAIKLGAVDNVILTVSTYSRGTVTASLQVANNADFTNAVTYGEQNIDKAGDYTFNVTAPVADMFYKVVIKTTNQTNSNGCIDVTNLKVNYSAASDTRQPAGLAYSDNSYSVKFGEIFQTPELSNPNNLNVTYMSSDEHVASVASDGAVTINGIGVTKITANFEGNDQFKSGYAEYTLNVYLAANSIAELKTLAKDTNVYIDFPMTVGFVNGKNIFVTDGAEWIQIYGGNSCEANDVIPAGWSATYTLYNDFTPELTNCVDFPASTEKGEITFREFTTLPTMANVNEVLILKNVTFAEATPSSKSNFNATFNGETVALRNNYGIASVEAGTYDVKILVSIFSGAASFYVVEYLDAQTENPVLAAPVIKPADGAKVPTYTQVEFEYPEDATLYVKTTLDEEFEEYYGWLYVQGAIGSTFSVEAYYVLNDVESEHATATYTISKADRGLSWINAQGETIEEVVYVMGKTGDDVWPFFDGNADGEITFTSSDTEVATAEIDWDNGTFKVTPLKAGTTVITLTVAEDYTYAEGSASYTLIVVDPETLPTTATFDFSTYSGITFIPELEEAIASGTQIINNVLEMNGVQISFAPKSTTYNQGVKIWKINNSDNFQLRVYSDAKMTITAPNLTYIESIEFTYDSSNFSLSPSVGTLTNGEWTPASQSAAARESAQIGAVTFEAGAKSFINSIKVNLGNSYTAIENVVVDDENAPVEYYNLQGVRVANPENGLYIRRQGSKATKVIIR